MGGEQVRPIFENGVRDEIDSAFSERPIRCDGHRVWIDRGRYLRRNHRRRSRAWHQADVDVHERINRAQLNESAANVSRLRSEGPADQRVGWVFFLQDPADRKD